MLIQIGAALSVMAQYIQRRGDVFQFCIRVPAHLHKSYGKQRIRQSLNTKDEHKALREVEKLARKYLAEFRVLTDGAKATPADITLAGELVAEKYNLGTFIDHVAEPLRQQYADGCEYTYDAAKPSEYLLPQQMEAWKALQAEGGPKARKLSDAFQIYLKTHQRGNEEAFIKKQQRDWNTLTATIGNIEFTDLNREQIRNVIDVLLQQGKKTTTVRRTITNLSAVCASAIREWALVHANPCEDMRIQGEGKDAEETAVANDDQLRQIIDAMQSETVSAPALLALMQMEIGARIGELSGLAVDDVVLDHEIPHIIIKQRPWRTLKTTVSERHVPLLGIALEAVKHALSLPRNGNGEDKGKGLFQQYAKERGNDSASAAVNKRLKPWKLTSHSFRHTMEDRLREAGCPEDVRNAIQGHTNGSAAEKYGKGHSLRIMREWLQKVTLPTTQP
jgi:integrase